MKRIVLCPSFCAHSVSVLGFHGFIRHFDVSKMSCGMYLMHIFLLGVWVALFKHTLALPLVAAIPMIAVTAFVNCYLITKIISFVPGSKYIIG